MKVASLRKRLRYRAVFPALSRLPQAPCYRAAQHIGRRDARSHPSRAAIARGMMRMFPRLAEDPAQLETLLERYFMLMAKSTLDCFYMQGLNPDSADRLITVHGIEHLAAARAAGRGVIIVISHFGRVSLLGPGLGFSGQRSGMLTTMVDQRNPHLDPVDRWFHSTNAANIQSHLGGPWITTGDNPRRIYQALKAGEAIIIVMDGLETNSDARVSFPFLGGTLSLPGGIMRIANKTGASLVYASTIDKDTGTEINLYPLPDEPEAGIAAAVKIFERDFADEPWQWWLWEALDAIWQPDVKNSAGSGDAEK